jgi:hypothetical protein
MPLGRGGSVREASMVVLRRFVSSLVVAGVLVLAAGASAATARARSICVPVHATGVGQDLGGGKTQATISVEGIVVGHTNASFTSSPIVGTSATFTGPIVFTSAAGTLTAEVAGSLNVATGDFQATSSSITGTGLVRKLTGRVTLAGHEDLTTDAFTETISGRLCE